MQGVNNGCINIIVIGNCHAGSVIEGVLELGKMIKNALAITM